MVVRPGKSRQSLCSISFTGGVRKTVPGRGRTIGTLARCERAARIERTDGMAKIGIGVNMEFVRHDDKPFEWGVEKAAELGYEYVEPMVHWGRELLSEAGYFHSVSMLDDPLRIKRACEKAGDQALRPLRPHAPHQARDRHRVPQAGRPLRRRVRRPGGQHRRRPQAVVDDRGGGLRADAATSLNEAAAVAEPRGILDRHRAAPAVQQDPGGAGPHQPAGRQPGDRHQLRHRQQLPRRPGPLLLAGARRGPPRPPARQGHLDPAERRRARQGDGHAGRAAPAATA